MSNSNEYIPYGRQTIDESDIDSVIEVLKENKYLTTGPRVQLFENIINMICGTKYAIAVNSGTAALHCATHVLNLNSDDEVIVPAISFAATSNCVLYCSAKPVFCDIDENTMNIDINKIENLITTKTKAIIFVDFAGQICNYQKLRMIANKYNLVLIEDAAHSFGLSAIKDSTADMICFSFHPVKNITTGEGGAVVTNNKEYYEIMNKFKSHGISVDYQKRDLHYYDIVDLGYNYRITDIQCALGISQSRKINDWISKRQEIANIYDKSFSKNIKIQPLISELPNAYHIYVIKVNGNRDDIFKKLKNMNIGVNVHYSPIYHKTLYKNLIINNKIDKPNCPIAEKIYETIITIPLYPTLTNDEINRVIKCVQLSVI